MKYSVLNSIAQATPHVLHDSIEAYFDDDNQPTYYKPTNTAYIHTPVDILFKDRGIYNKELDSLIACLPAGAVVAGSFVASILSPRHKPSDIDIFFTSPGAFLTTCNLFTKPPSDDNAWMFKGYISSIDLSSLESSSKKVRVVTFKHPDPTRLPIQLVKMVWYPSAHNVIDSFDFTVTQLAISDGQFISHPAALVDLFNNNLILHRPQFPMETLYRLIKYAKKGYNIPPRTLKHVTMHIREATELGPPMPFVDSFY